MQLSAILAELTGRARNLGLTDSEWAARAGVRKETLSRLRHRATCELDTLRALAQAVGATIGILPAPPVAEAPDGRFPRAVNRHYEERLLAMVSSGDLSLQTWRAAGPSFFMAGLAVMIASVRGMPRARLLELAETLHAGSSVPEVFNLWLSGSPVRPSRFLPLLREGLRRAA